MGNYYCLYYNHDLEVTHRTRSFEESYTNYIYEQHQCKRCKRIYCAKFNGLDYDPKPEFINGSPENVLSELQKINEGAKWYTIDEYVKYKIYNL